MADKDKDIKKADQPEQVGGAESKKANKNHGEGKSAGFDEGVDEDAFRKEVEESVASLRAELEDLETENWAERVQRWGRRNPTLAVFVAAGTGILAGRTARKVKKSFEPDPMPVRMQKRASKAAKDAQEQARIFGDKARKQMQETGKVVGEQAKKLQNEAQRSGAKWAKDMRQLGNQTRKRAKELQAEAEKVGKSTGSDLEKRAQKLAEQGWKFGERTANEARKLSEQASERAQQFSKRAAEQSQKLAEKSESAGEDVKKKARWFGKRAQKEGQVLGESGKKSWLGFRKKASKQADRAADAASDLVEDGKSTSRAKRIAWNAARAVAATLIVRKAADMFRK